MGIRVFWEDDNQRIIRLEFEGKWTWQEVYQASQESIALREQAGHPAVVLVDQRKATNSVPVGAVHHLSNLIHMGRADRRLLVVVTPFEFYHQLARIVLGVYRELGRKIIMVRTMEEADAALEPYRSEAAPPSSQA